MARTSIIFFGSGPVAAASLESLAKHFLIESVITKSVPEHHKGPAAPVELLATKLELPIIYANTKSELDSIIDCLKIESKLGVLVDYGVMISKKTIDKFVLGIVNSHFSLLPQWRGADPITFSLLSGQPKTGVSLMLIEPTLDTGKLITRKSITISKDDTVVTLTNKLVDFSNNLLVEFIPKYSTGLIQTRRQPHPDRATYSRKLTKSNGQIDWTKPAEQIEREVRAYLGWPSSYSTISGHTIKITKSHTSQSSASPMDIKCGDNNYLSIDEVTAPSGRKMSAQAFLNGYKIK